MIKIVGYLNGLHKKKFFLKTWYLILGGPIRAPAQTDSTKSCSGGSGGLIRLKAQRVSSLNSIKSIYEITCQSLAVWNITGYAFCMTVVGDSLHLVQKVFFRFHDSHFTAFYTLVQSNFWVSKKFNVNCKQFPSRW